MKKRIRGNYLELKLMPGRLTALVAEGKAKVVGKDKFGRRVYEIEESSLLDAMKR